MSRLKRQTNQSIRSWFTRINKKAFRGRLAKTFIQYANIDVIADTCRHYSIDQEWFTVRLSRKIQFSRSLSLIALAHEMIHVEHWKWDHGRKFEKRLIEVIEKAGLSRFL